MSKVPGMSTNGGNFILNKVSGPDYDSQLLVASDIYSLDDGIHLLFDFVYLFFCTCIWIVLLKIKALLLEIIM